jgi:uncharacterized protein YhhL (DUF1145 family)
MKDEGQPREAPKRGYRMPFPMGLDIVMIAILIVSIVIWFVHEPLLRLFNSEVPSSQSQPVLLVREQRAIIAPLGTIILKNYASPAQTPQQDLTDISHVLGNFVLLVKGDQPLPFGANEEVAAALRGKNRTQLRFLPDDAPCFNAKGQIVDRWQTPLFFHAEARDKIDIRSAGPDKQMWTADDIHRHYDGQFLRGDALHAPSLIDVTKGYRGR